jgi:hypothetical protein
MRSIKILIMECIPVKYNPRPILNIHIEQGDYLLLWQGAESGGIVDA